MGRLAAIEMGGIGCSITSSDGKLGQLVERRYHSFLSTQAPQLHIDAELVGSPQQVVSPLEIQSGPVITHLNGQFLQIIGEGFTADFDFLSKRGHIRQPLNLTPLDLLLKAVYGYYLLQEKAFFIHACAVIRNGMGSLFFGPTGSGKSTLARISQDEVLGDELVIVSKDGKGESEDNSTYSIHGTPFWGGINSRASLAKLYSLRFSRQESSLTAMARVQTLRQLLPCVGYFALSPQQQNNLFDLAVSLVQRVPCHELNFAPQPQFWSWLDAHVN